MSKQDTAEEEKKVNKTDKKSSRVETDKDNDSSEEAVKSTPKKKKKDPRAPKKNLNAWMFFVQDIRPQVVAELGEDGKKVALVTKAAGERWARMTAEEKAPYEQMAAKDKKRYQAELEQFNSK